MADPPKEGSDLFKVQEARPSLAPVGEVLLPPEERRKQRLKRIAIGVVLAILLGLTGWTIRHFWHRHAVEANANEAGETGRPEDVQDALDTLDSGELLGLRARLKAVLALAGEGSIADAEAAHAAVPDDDAHEASERLKAFVYISLAKGENAAALEAANRLISAGDFAAETAHAKSLAQLANGIDAVAEATAAAQLAAGPRYVAQRARAMIATGEVDSALETLEAVQGQSPAVTLAKARALHQGYREGAGEAATTVTTAEDATVAEKAWAKALLASLAAREGDRGQARSLAAEALQSPPPGDHAFRWFVAETLLEADDPQAAAATIEGVPASGPVADAAQRGRVMAGLALARGRADEAIEHLSAVAASPAAFLLVGQARRMDEQLDEARASYDRAAEHDSHAARAHAARAALELEDGEDEQALVHARAALEADATHPAVAPVAVSALLANDQQEEAGAVAEAALEAHPNDVRLLAAKADVLLAREQWDEALNVLRSAIERDESDAELHAELGDAARGAERWDEAASAYERALELEESYPSALQGLYQLHVATHDLAEAEAVWAQMDEADVRIIEPVAMARVRHIVDVGSGRSGLRELRRLMRRRDLRGSPELRSAFAELLLQQENYNRAYHWFNRVRVLGDDDVNAYLGQALAQVLAGRMNRATERLRDAADASMAEDAAEDATPPAYQMPRYRVARGWIEAKLGRYRDAMEYAQRVLDEDPEHTGAQLLMGHSLERSRRISAADEHWRAAAENVPRQPYAMGKLAVRLGPTEEGCELAVRYLEAAPRGELEDAVESVRERCEEEE